MKYGIYSSTVNGLNLFSTHRSKAVAERKAAIRTAEGASCVVLPLKK